jgi:ubiquitin C-terminal hydrolase
MKISKQQYAENGYTGMQNLGNTCFLNSCIQALNHTYEIHEILNKQSVNDRMKISTKPLDVQIFRDWKQLAELMWSGNGAVNPMQFVKTVHHIAHKKGIDIFTGWAQNDVTEFLRFIVNCFHTSIARGVKVNISGKPATQTDAMAMKCYEMLNINYAKEYSEIQDLFYGIFISEISNVKTGASHSLTPEQYFILDLPIPEKEDTITLYDCMDEFSKRELMTGENRWHNEKTGEKEDVYKQIRFWNFPKILVIALKRFDASGRKTERMVNFPINDLDLSKYVEDYFPNKYMYDLYGICNHMGSTNGGHYTAFVKNKNDKWIYCNDETVSLLNNLTQMITPMAYCLFYRIK